MNAALSAGPVLDHRHPALQPLIRSGFAGERLDQVLAFYDEPHRRYHDRLHVCEMLDAAVAMSCALTPAQSLAVVFHDAIYVPGAARGVNEAMSAQLLRVYAGDVAPDTLELAYRIVIDTADHLPRSPESRLVLDLDLMRLSVSDSDFERYSRAVFAEQRPLITIADDELAWGFFQRRRIGFFERLLERPEIFCLPPFRLRYEEVTRENLLRSIAAARSTSTP
jgi:predicted metal-dependent HD superfamily phosphohydrolase